MLSKKAKIIFSLIFAVCIVLSTVGGIFAAKQVSEIGFGEQIKIDSLDSDEEAVQGGMLNVLLLGVDEGGNRSDTIMLCSIDGNSNRVNVLSIPRDTRVLIGKNHQKINAAIGIGAQEVSKGKLSEPEELTIQKVKAITGLPIHYFATVDFDGFKEIIDVLGGVDYEVPFDMNYDDPAQNLHIHLKAGMQHLDGQAAHDFVRFRKGNVGTKGYAMGDLGRIAAQQEFMTALIEQKLTPQYLTKINELYSTIQKYVRTNYTTLDLAKHFSIIKNIDVSKIQMHQLPGVAQNIDGISYYVYNEADTAELVEKEFTPRSKEEDEKIRQEELETDSSASETPNYN